MSQIAYEEDEASRRDANKDLELHRSVCVELCRTMDRLKELKTSRSVSLTAKNKQFGLQSKEQTRSCKMHTVILKYCLA